MRIQQAQRIQWIITGHYYMLKLWYSIWIEYQFIMGAIIDYNTLLFYIYSTSNTWPYFIWKYPAKHCNGLVSRNQIKSEKAGDSFLQICIFLRNPIWNFLPNIPLWSAVTNIWRRVIYGSITLESFWPLEINFPPWLKQPNKILTFVETWVCTALRVADLVLRGLWRLRL